MIKLDLSYSVYLKSIRAKKSRLLIKFITYSHEETKNHTYFTYANYNKENAHRAKLILYPLLDTYVGFSLLRSENCKHNLLPNIYSCSTHPLSNFHRLNIYEDILPINRVQF